VRETDDPAKNPLTQTGPESSATQLFASALSLPSTHPDPALSHAVMGSHVAIMR
jgi:hypothetical protein